MLHSASKNALLDTIMSTDRTYYVSQFFSWFFFNFSVCSVW